MEVNKIAQIINVIITIIAAITIIYVVVKFEKNENKLDDTKSSTIASSIGMLGTFIGITIGLLTFNPDDMDKSIPLLLGGMKIAFVTSIFGMIASLYIKVRQKKMIDETEEENIDDITELFNSMNNQMKYLNRTLRENQNQTTVIFENMSNIFANNQKSLNDEIKSLNISLNKKQDILIDEFRIFGEQMAQNNTDALIDALNNVIKDFNNKISEQFGENFKELNNAVYDLVNWQENYKDIIVFNTKQLNKTIETMTSVEKSLKEIESSSQTLIDMSNQVSTTCNYIERTNEGIEKGLIALDEISNKALQSIPNLDTYFVKYTQDLDTMINKLSECVPSISEDLKNSYIVFNESLDTFKYKIESTLDVSAAQFKAQYETIEKTNKNLGIQLEEVTLKVSENIKSLVEQEEKVLQAKVQQLDELLEKELTKSLNSFATQLATISERFAKDYIPLADKLKDVVNIAKGA